MARLGDSGSSQTRSRLDPDSIPTLGRTKNHPRCSQGSWPGPTTLDRSVPALGLRSVVVAFFDAMLKVECEACKAPYQVDERRVPPTGLKMRCPKCGHSFVVAQPNAIAGAPPRPAVPARPPRPAPKTTMMGVGTGSVPPEPGPVQEAGDFPKDDPFANLPAAKSVEPAFGSARRPEIQKQAPTSLGTATAPGLGEFDEFTDLPAVLEDAGLPTISPRPAAPRPPPPRANPPKLQPQPPSLADFDIELPSAKGNQSLPKPAARANLDLTFDVDLPLPRVDLPSPKPGQSAGSRREHADLPAIAANLPSTKTAAGFGEIDGRLAAMAGRSACSRRLPAL
jgi:predicted Zn finger-like uncharacterized protein